MGVKFGVHPLYFVVGFYYALNGRITEFLIYSVTAVIHELGHSVSAEKRGYKFNKITLTPFGAVAFGDARGLKFYDEIFIALAGPLVNIAVGILFVAVWWIFPITYAFTDVAAEANFTLALINLIPAYPLDGGRILSALLSAKLNREKADKICRIAGAVLGTAIAGLFILSLFYRPNFTLLFFGAFVIFGAVLKDKENKLARIDKSPRGSALLRGMPIKRQAISDKATLKTLLRITDGDCINEIEVYGESGKVATLSQSRITQILKTESLYAKIGDVL